ARYFSMACLGGVARRPRTVNSRLDPTLYARHPRLVNVYSDGFALLVRIIPVGRSRNPVLIERRTDAGQQGLVGHEGPTFTRHPIMAKKKGVLKKIGDAVATGAEAAVDAGAKAIHAVGKLMPGAATKKKSTKKAATKKAAPKAPTSATKKTATKKAAAKT